MADQVTGHDGAHRPKARRTAVGADCNGIQELTARLRVRRPRAMIDTEKAK